ncbi:hypothetical protein CRENBAI_022109 [Crenichthys baileyi]|uniref:Uncharacterized protein n=1 Tax=Crenichthys baileyi TaxID=28760 RepID=A0AAV9SN98_9TELE
MTLATLLLELGGTKVGKIHTIHPGEPGPERSRGRYADQSSEDPPQPTTSPTPPGSIGHKTGAYHCGAWPGHQHKQHHKGVQPPAPYNPFRDRQAIPTSLVPTAPALVLCQNEEEQAALPRAYQPLCGACIAHTGTVPTEAKDPPEILKDTRREPPQSSLTP